MSETKFPPVAPEQYISAQFDRIILPLVAVERLPLARQFLGDTLRAYSKQGRYYHDLTHILICLQKLEPYAGRPDYHKLWLALLWHDEVYDTSRHDNEEQSAALGHDRTQALGIDGADDIARLIVATKHHTPHAEDEALVCAIDMSILAEPQPVYDAYTRAIRLEYGQYSDELYAAGRQAALKTFSAPFQHPDFVHLNPLAEQNVARELAGLSA